MPNLPLQLLNSLSQLKNFDRDAFIEAHQEENKITSIRLNPFKKTSLDFELNDPVLWNTSAYYLDQRPSFTLDPLFQAGCYYVQEAGSMFIEYALKQHQDFSKPLKVLDLCGAPGGKSTLLNSMLSSESLLVANELIKSRADILVQNLSKWGTSNTVVTNNDPSRYNELDGFFDIIVVDAPCSGSGLFRKQPTAIDEWSEDAVIACSIRQKKILEDVLPALASNGLLVYSTCSYSEQENEALVNWLCAEQDMEYLPLTLPAGSGITETNAGYRFYPHLTQSEGFFCAVLRKNGNTMGSGYHKKKNSLEPTKAETAILEPFLAASDNNLIKKNNQFHFMNQAALEFLSSFEKHFYFKKAGVVVGEIKGKDMIPNQELAWFTGLSEQLAKADLDKDTALSYLRKQNFSVDKDRKGLHLMTYKNQGLGWAKLLPNRINNYLPNELRILS